MSVRAESPDQQLLNKLRTGDNQGFTTLYRQIYPSIERFVVQNNGSRDEAEDLFQETLLVLLTTCQDTNFQLTSSLKTYVFSISKNLWLKQLKKSTRWTDLENADETHSIVAPVELDLPLSALEKVMAILAKLTIRCQTLLLAIFFRKKEIINIVQDEGYSNSHSAQNQKYKCLQQARKVGRNEP